MIEKVDSMNNNPHLIIEVIIALTRFYSSVADTFFKARLENKISALLENCLDDVGQDHVAQYGSEQKHLLAVGSLIELVEEMKHLNIGSSTPLLFTLDSLLRYKLHLLRSLSPDLFMPPIAASGEDKTAASPPDDADRPVKISSAIDKIYQFIKSTPNTRTKDIVDHFKHLSERTVKRSLKELTRLGSIEKRSENKAVFYSSKD